MKENNTGENNTGNCNSGNWNSGNCNSGNCNSGNRNSGDWNSGDCNSGDWNSGNRNSGNRNSGDCNSGNWNSGNWNSGNRNSGDCNSGYCNSGDWNSGYFNTNSPDKIRIFNTWVDITHQEFNEKYDIYADIPLNRWIDIKDIEKPTPQQSQMGGYLKTLDFKEACRIWWNENPDRHKDFLSLPNFDKDIFKEITGIDVEETDDKTQEAMKLLKEKGYKIVKE